MTTQNPYLLLTPGPLSTTPAVREAMLRGARGHAARLVYVGRRLQ